MVKRIDPLQMRWPEERLLAEYIKQNPNLTFIRKSDDSENAYSVQIGNGYREFLLTHSILLRERKPGKPGYRYEVVGEKVLGKGTAGVILPVFLTLGLEGKYLHPIPKQKKRVVKVQNIKEEQGEAKISQQLAHLHAKAATFDNNKAYTVLKRMPGKDLREIFDREKLSTEQKLQLLLALFKAWQHQVLDNGLVHRDIKPENIMVNFIPGNPVPEVNIIDFGFAKKIGDESNELAGTFLYIPPEILEWMNSDTYPTYTCLPVIDIYALSKVAYELFAKNYSFGDQEPILQYLADKLLSEGML